MDLSLEKLKEAVSLREQIQNLEDRLSALFGGGGSSSRASSSSNEGGSTTSAPTGGAKRGRPRGQMSEAARAKLSAAAKARWAARRGTGGGASSGGSTASSGATATGGGGAKSGKRKGGITPEGRRRLAEAMRARWAARRKTGAPNKRKG